MQRSRTRENYRKNVQENKLYTSVFVSENVSVKFNFSVLPFRKINDERGFMCRVYFNAWFPLIDCRLVLLAINELE